MSAVPEGDGGAVSGSGYSILDFKAEWSRIRAESDALIGPSLADRLALAERDEPGFTERLLDEIGPVGCMQLLHDEAFWLRPKQLAAQFEADAEVILNIGGRGSGKTGGAGPWILDRLERGARELVFVGPTMAEVKQYQVGGRKKRIDSGAGSGFLDILPPWVEYDLRDNNDEALIDLPQWKATIWLWSGMLSEFRGPNPDTVWCDEVIKWRHPVSLISNLRLACRSVRPGMRPQMLITTSPKRLQFLRDLVMERSVRVIHAFTWENRGNVAESWYLNQAERLGESRQAREELQGELEVDDGDELFPLSTIDAHRVDEAPKLDRIVVAVDPAGSQHRKSDKTGIIGAGRAGDVHHGHGYLLGDVSGTLAWDAWGLAALDLALELGASAIVMEKNKFADAVAANLAVAGQRRGFEKRSRPGFKSLNDLVHPQTGRRIQLIEVLAMGDKGTRAGPVSTLYQAGRIHHVGNLSECETEMSEFDPAEIAVRQRSPNRMDALVHAFTELFALDRPASTDYKAGFSGLREAIAGSQQRSADQARRAEPATPVAATLAVLRRGYQGGSL